jgi:1-acyl-sn-glycerol-3-phosphate acyltransferase
MKKKLPGKFSMAIRSTLFIIILPLFTVFWGTLCFISCILPLKVRYPIVVCWTDFAVWLLKHICCIDYKIEGLENFKEKNLIVLSKHSSSWETFFLPHYCNMPAIILKSELRWVPFFGWGMYATDPIVIDRSKKSSSMAQIIEIGKKDLDEGRTVLMFPEGTRIPYGKFGKYKLGGARLSVATGYSVLPVAHNAARYWPKRKFLKTPGTVTIVFGPVMKPDGLTAEELMAKVQDWIESTIERIDGKKAVPL